jgi:hypothetical protein
MSLRDLAASALGLSVALGLAAGAAGAQDMGALARDQVGLPLAPSDAAAQTWTLEDRGRTVCRVGLKAEMVAKGVRRADIPVECAASLPAGVAGWKPVTDGAALVDAQGEVLIDFNRWSPSLLVSHRSSGGDLQLRRNG